MKTVAVITRTKDRELFLARAIQSVSAQTMDDYVHVIVNDGGDRDIVDKAVARQPEAVRAHIATFHRDVSSGAPDTIFNESIRRADSKYFVIHDDDDTWHPEFLERTCAVLETGQQAVVVRTDKVTEAVQGDQIIEKKRSHYMPDLHAVNLYRQCIDNQLTPIATLIRRSAYEEVGGFDDALAVCGDWDFGIRFLKKYNVAYCDPGFALAFYHHRIPQKDQRPDNSFSGQHTAQYWTNYLMNKYLREELADGRLGVGFIMSKLRYDEHMVATRLKRVLPTGVVELLKRRVR